MMIAGEVSGDIHGSYVVKKLKEFSNDIEIFGVGGDEMQNAGMEIVEHIKEISFMGFFEVAKNLSKIFALEKKLIENVKLRKPNLVLLIDYPGFNLRFASKIKQLGIKIFYYVGPQIWAWKKNRILKIKKYIDKVFLVFPFEVDLYKKHNINAEFVGHPLTEEIFIQKSKEEFLEENNLNNSKKIIGFFPGSRKQEIQNIFPIMLKTANQLNKKLDVQCVVGVASSFDLSFIQEFIPKKIEIKLLQNQTHHLMKHCNVAVVTSGTATLETAFLETPMIVVYKTLLVNFLLAKLFVKIKHISLVNIVAKKEIVLEFIQRRANVENLFSAVKKLIENNKLYNDTKSNLVLLKNQFESFSASTKVAEAIYSYLKTC